MTLFIEHLKTRGAKARLARAISVHKATVTRWMEKGVPIDRLADVERETGVPSAEIRPDIAAVFAPTETEGHGA